MTDSPRPEVRTEVSGAPEEIWRLIATGPGIATWFMPATVEPRVGGKVTHRHGAGDEDTAEGTITAYEPGRRFAYEEELEPGRTLATEFLVEARSGGTCVVRVVSHGLTADDAGFAEGLTAGWTQALAVLRIHQGWFAGRPSGSSRLWTRHDGALDHAWATVVRRIGLEDAAPGDRVERRDGDHPPFAGVVEVVQPHAVLVRTDDGVLSFIATEFGGHTSVVIDRYVHGEGAQATAEADRRAWEAALG